MCVSQACRVALVVCVVAIYVLTRNSAAIQVLSATQHARPCRYSDLLCHYQIKAALRGSKTPFNATALVVHSKRFDDAMRRHRALERDVQEHFLAIYFRAHAGRRYNGEVLTVNKDGSAEVQITDLGIERSAKASGMISIGSKHLWWPVVEAHSDRIAWEQAD
jgi:hypothetical protein